jgi:MYXO-CTERM domain-containing protein
MFKYRFLVLLGVFATGGCAASDDPTGHLARRLGSTSMVISQIYGGGGNSGAVLTYDYVELFNRGTASVSLSGWSIQYTSASSSTYAVNALSSATVPPGGYYLFQLASQNTSVGSPLPSTADGTGASNMSASNGKVALLNDITACGSGCATTNTAVVDFVGYGTANEYEGTAAASLGSNNGVLLRGGVGCTDTNINSSDFSLGTWVTTSSITLHNSASTPAPCGGGTEASVALEAAVAADHAPPSPDLPPPPKPDSSLVPVEPKTSDAAVPVPDAPTAVDLNKIVDANKTADAAKIAESAVAPDTKPAGDITVVTAGTVVLSQVYGGGGNSGATYNHDFLELFNRTANTIAIGGWSVQYGSTANNFSQKVDIPLGATIAPYGYFLVQLTGGTTGSALPTPDLDATAGATSFNLSASNGKVALVMGTALLACGTSTSRCTSSAILDLVGYGTSSDYEGTAASTPSSAADSLFRKNGGCTDTNDNSADITTAAVSPRNSASATNNCTTVLFDGGAVTHDSSAKKDSGHKDSARKDSARKDKAVATGDATPTVDLSQDVGGAGGDVSKTDARKKDSGTTKKDDEEGCACSTSGAGDPGTLGLGWLLLLGAVLARRRRR